jgi:hypothetical protein
MGGRKTSSAAIRQLDPARAVIRPRSLLLVAKCLDGERNYIYGFTRQNGQELQLKRGFADCHARLHLGDFYCFGASLRPNVYRLIGMITVFTGFAILFGGLGLGEATGFLQDPF